MKFLKEKDENICQAFLELPKITLSDGALPDKIKFLIHAAITASQHDLESTTMHITGPIRDGTGERELFETAATIINVYSLSSFGVFLDAWKMARQKEAQPK